MKKLTLVFVVKKEGENISEICLAMKKRGYGVNRWNGAGGKLEEGETFEQGAIRETFEEIGVKVIDLYQVSEMYFKTDKSLDWTEHVKAYYCENWEGEVMESEEMKPKWFDVKEIPFNEMWEEVIHWLPNALLGKKQECKFIYDDKDHLLSFDVKETSSFL